MSEQLRVVIADDHPAFVEGLKALVHSAPTIEVVGSARSGSEAVTVAETLQPDVVIMDLHMPDLNGIEATQRIVATSPHIAVLVLTMMEDNDSLFSAVRAGARGYLLKGAGRAEVVRAVEAVGGGEIIFGPGIAERMIGFFAAVAAEQTTLPVDQFSHLTDREQQLLDLIAAGKDNTEIARELFLSLKTVRNHVSNIFTKLQVAHRAQAIVLAREAGMGRRPTR